jgi:hypothetical protein
MLEGVGHDHRDRLVVVVDVIFLQQREPAADRRLDLAVLGFLRQRMAFCGVITSSRPGTSRAALSSMRTTRPLGIVLVTRTA